MEWRDDEIEERPADMDSDNAAAAPAAGQGMEAARALTKEQEDKRKTNMGARPHEDCGREGAQEQPLIKQLNADLDRHVVAEIQAADAEAATAKQEEGIGQHNVTIQGMVRNCASCLLPTLLKRFPSGSPRVAIPCATSVAMVVKPSVSSSLRLSRSLA